MKESQPRAKDRTDKKVGGGNKDIWDKISALTVPFVTLVLGVLGAYATRSYNEQSLRQQGQTATLARESQAAQATADLNARLSAQQSAKLIAETQMLERMYPFISSSDPKKRMFGYEMFSEFGRKELATRLAAEDRAAVPFLRRLQQDPDPAVRRAASMSLAELLSPENRAALISSYESQGQRLAPERRQALNNLLDFVRRDPLRNVPETAFVLAMIHKITDGSFALMAERGTQEYLEGRYGVGTSLGRNLGNTQPGDGYLYRGRGYSDLTGRANYARVSNTLGLTGTADDLVEHPDRALDPEIAWRIMRDSALAGGSGSRIHSALDQSPPDYARAYKVFHGGNMGFDSFMRQVKIFEGLLRTTSGAAPR